MDVARLDERLREASSARGFQAASVAVVDGRGITFSRAYGEGIEAGTRFPIASIMKLVTALCVVRLADEGRLSLDRPVVGDVAGFHFDEAARGSSVTLRHLLMHTSGLPPAGRDWGPPNPGALSRFAREDLAGHRFLADPGSVAAYSSTAISLAGLAVEEAAGMTFPLAVAELVGRPVGADIFFPDGEERPERLAWPHERDEDGPRPVPRLADNPAGYPSAFALASAESLGRLVVALLEDRPVPLESLVSAVVSRHVDAAPYALARASAGHGLGCFAGSYNGHRVIRHGGMTQGGQCSLDIFPDDGKGLVVLTTGADEQAFSGLLGDLYALVLGGAAVTEEPEIEALEAKPGLDGTYVDPEGGGRIDVETVDGQTVLRRGDTAAPLVATVNSSLLVNEGHWTPVWAPRDEPPGHLVVWGVPYFRTDLVQWLDAPPSFDGLFRDTFWPDPDSDLALQCRDGRWSVTAGGVSLSYDVIGRCTLLGGHGLIHLADDARSLRLGSTTRFDLVA